MPKAGFDLAAKSGAYRGKEPLPRPWPGIKAAPTPRFGVGIVPALEIYDGALGIDPAFSVGARFTVSLRDGWELELPVSTAFATADVVTPPPPSAPTSGPTVTSRSGQITSIEVGVRKRIPLRNNTWSASVGGSVGTTVFSGFDSLDDTAFSGSLVAGLERTLERGSVFFDVRLRGIATDFNGNSRKLQPAVAFGFGFICRW